MIKYLSFLFLIFCLLTFGCGGNGDDDDDDSENAIYKQYMHSFVQDISTWAKSQSPGFIIIPQCIIPQGFSKS